MHSKAGMWHHVGSTMKIVRNTLFVVGGKGEKGRLRTILLVTAIAATQEGGSPSQHHATGKSSVSCPLKPSDSAPLC